MSSEQSADQPSQFQGSAVLAVICAALFMVAIVAILTSNLLTALLSLAITLLLLAAKPQTLREHFGMFVAMFITCFVVLFVLRTNIIPEGYFQFG